MNKKNFFQIFLALLVTASVSGYSMYRYVSGPLNGNFSSHIMSAKHWGVPVELEKNGIEPLYTAKNVVGWDGQFYYFMANDLLAQKDTSEHIDADAYRYQRIGLPLFAKILSVVTLQDWVSTQTYYASSFILILLAVLVGGHYFARNNVSPLWMLPWSLGIGTQITMLNGLPDAAADAFFIIALVACLSRRYWFYCVFISFAALSREAYILFPLIFFAGMTWVQFKTKEHQFRLLDWLLCAIPIVLFACWHIFVRVHFDKTPELQASKILGFPLISTFTHMFAGLSGHYPGAPEGAFSRLQGADIVFYLILLFSTYAAAFKFSPLKKLNFTNILPTALSLYLISLISLYLFFGDTVMGHFTGYMKAASLFLFLWPFFILLSGGKIQKHVGLLLLAITILFGKQAWDIRIKQPTIFSRYEDVICTRDAIATSKKCMHKLIIPAKKLPGTLGEVVNTERIVSNKDGQGFVSYGPYIKLEGGHYKFTLSYSGRPDQVDKALGYWDIGRFVPADSVIVLHKAELQTGENVFAEITIQIPEEGIELIEIRVWFNGAGTMTMKHLEIEKLD
ncbi:hypothetical protein [Undibacterium sp.]|uniref:hypothetical protein n=1 Tax=Undibacterium sp. TaxID=1914977 RepID=UPI0037515BBD